MIQAKCFTLVMQMLKCATKSQQQNTTKRHYINRHILVLLTPNRPATKHQHVT